jgi:phosphoribosylformimino-5-aminoimidazole carboxamide ribotide isomerase
MPILPVLDIRRGQVVRGIAGRRSEYRPIVSTLCPTAWPADVARALAEQFAVREFYVADLDAIGGSPPAQATYEQLQADGYRLWIDAGVRTAADAARVASQGVYRIVIGLETVEDPACLAAICRSLSNDRVVFSLDLKGGEPLGDLHVWRAATADDIVERAVAAGITRLLVLDLSRVGVGGGTGTELLCARLHHAYPTLSLAAGGGVRGASDVRRLYRCGVRHVLVASALHDSRLSRVDVAALQSEPLS